MQANITSSASPHLTSPQLLDWGPANTFSFLNPSLVNSIPFLHCFFSDSFPGLSAFPYPILMAMAPWSPPFFLPPHTHFPPLHDTGMPQISTQTSRRFQTPMFTFRLQTPQCPGTVPSARNALANRTDKLSALVELTPCRRKRQQANKDMSGTHRSFQENQTRGCKLE